MLACPISLPCTSRQPSPGARGSLLSHRPPRVRLLRTQGLLRACMDLALLDPRTLVKLRKPSWSTTLWPVQTWPRLLSTQNMLLQLAERPSEMVPSSDMLASPSSLPCTSRQPSPGARGSLLSHPPPRGMRLHTEALLALLDLRTLAKLRKPSWSTTPWQVQTNMLFWLAARPSELGPSSEMRGCAGGIYASSGASAVEGEGGRFGSVIRLFFFFLLRLSTLAFARRGMASCGLYP